MSQIFTIRELAQHLQVHIGTVRKWVYEKTIQYEPKVPGEYRKFDLDCKTKRNSIHIKFF